MPGTSRAPLSVATKASPERARREAPRVRTNARQRLPQSRSPATAARVRRVDRRRLGVRDRRRRLGGTRERVRREPIGQPVRFADGVLEARERIDDRERTERFFVHRLRRVRHFGDDRRLEEVALVADSMSTGFYMAAVFLRVLDVRVHGRRAARCDAVPATQALEQSSCVSTTLATR